MKLYAISDLHLPGPENKDMKVFGPRWEGYVDAIRENWQQTVTTNDVVLCPGDISWAMKLEEMVPDFEYLSHLPGRILIVKGNHDYWWQSLKKVRESLPDNVFALQNDHYRLTDKIAVCGTRGWLCPGHPDFGTDDQKIFQREINRLQLSLTSALQAGLRPEIVMLHYPPTNGETLSEFTDLMEENGVKLCVYGHLHGGGRSLSGCLNGVKYHLVACDAIGFTPKDLGDIDVSGDSRS